MRIAVDTGYGYTKAVSESGGRVVFPSAVAPARGSGDLAAVIGSGAQRHQVEITVIGDEDHRAAGAWLVGDAALSAGAARTWNTEASARRDYEILTLTALALVGPADGEEIELAAGLPLGIWLNRRERKAVKERLQGLRAWVRVDSAEAVLIRIAEAWVFPQGLGAYLTALKAPGGEKLVQGDGVGVIDIGYRTTDALLLVPNRSHPGSLVPFEEGCFSLDAGAGQIYQRVRQSVERLSGRMIPASAVENALDIPGREGRLKVQGVEYDVAAMAADEAEHLVAQIEAETRLVWGVHYDLLSALLVTGGGGSLCWNTLRNIHPHASLVRDPVFANAAGFLVFLTAKTV